MNPTNCSGIKKWRNSLGQLHRLDGPAVEYSTGSREWYQNGLRHRIGGPAVESADGGKFWWQNGMRHRINGPAVMEANGYRAWYQSGMLHRTDGPAQIWPGLFMAWHVNGVELRRVDFPTSRHGPSGDRTHDLSLRRRSLCPTEL